MNEIIAMPFSAAEDEDTELCEAALEELSGNRGEDE